MAFNWKVVLILIAICAGMLIIVDYAVALESNVTIIAEPTPAPTATPPPSHIPMIQQGDDVYIGDYVDVSGFCAGYSELAYWDGYDMYDEPPKYNFTFANNKMAYINFYVDPSIFEGKYGRWFKYNRVYESRGNNLAFIVYPKEYRNVSTTLQNGTVIYQNKSEEHEYKEFSVEEKLLTIKKVKDYIISSEEHFNITVDKGLSALWLFDKQSNNIIYTTCSNGELVIPASEIIPLESGSYKILIQRAKDNATKFDVIYDTTERKIKWFDQSVFDVHELNTDNMVPEIAIKKLGEIFPKTSDTYTVKTLIISDPEITVNSMQEMYIGDAKSILKDSTLRGNVSVMEVKGYTNVRGGIGISVTLDEETTDPREIKRMTYNTTAIGGDLSEWRQYRVYVPLYWDSLEPGMHTLVARTDIGGFVNADFPVIEAPPDSYQPPEIVRWVGDENPWKANLTYVTVIETKEVIKEVIKEVGPTDEQVYAQQQKVLKEMEEERWEGYKNMAIAGICLLACVVGGIFLIRYLIRVWRRVKNNE